MLQGQFTELLVLDTKIRFEPSLENNWGNPLTLAQYFFDLSDDNVRGQVKAFIKILDRDFSLGARSHHSLKLFANLMLSMRPGTMRDEFITVALKILERASRKLNHNIVKNGARAYAFTSESPGVLTLNTVPFYISRRFSVNADGIQYLTFRSYGKKGRP